MKKEVLNFCDNYVKKRIQGISHQMKDIQLDITAETKSSAGDKHETGRAMMQLEREKLGNYLAEAEKMQRILQKVNLSKTSVVSLGSLVVTSGMICFIAVSAGKTVLNNQPVYCISMATPVAQAMMGKGVGASFVINGKTHTIQEIH
ncbi:hypothetical protein GCM10009117_02380 [Gangjinia marincola]|uniref:3-oxoacyl-ACP synthase n=1 Tax=Gangjinia marincola TaxID=578463 RepID=A0ABN1MDB1_9FLAO